MKKLILLLFFIILIDLPSTGQVLSPDYVNDYGIIVVGHSQVENTAGGVLFTERWPGLVAHEFAPPIPVVNMGVGGESAAQISARFLQYNQRNNQIVVIMAIRNGVLTLTTDEQLASIQSIVNAVRSNRFVIISDLPYLDGSEEPGSPNRNKLDTMNSLLRQTFPNNYLDIVTLFNDPATRVADKLHISPYGGMIMKTQVANFIKSKNWIPRAYYK